MLMRLHIWTDLGGGGSKTLTRALLLGLAAALVALLAMSPSANAQDSCRRTEHLGELRSHQTITRIGLLNSSSCRLDGVNYYDYYDFQLSGAGEVRIRVSSSDFDERVALNTARGEFLAGQNGSYELVRTLPAGHYRVLAISRQNERAGAYTLTIRTGQLAAAPPPPPLETTTDDEEVVPPDEDEAEVVRGHVIARVERLPENDRRGRYRIEFGFLSSEVLASGTDRTAVVEENEHLLPERRRFLNESYLLAAARSNDRRWLRSDPVDVLPLEDDDAGLSGEPLLTGQVIARWSPTPGGTFRVEFGFLPDCAFQVAGDDTQRAAEQNADLLPNPGRYLTQSRINGELRRDQPRWLTSTEVEIPVVPVAECDGPPPNGITPVAVPLTLSRSEPIDNESIAVINGELAEVFTPVVVTGLPPGLEWDLAETSADGNERQLTVSGTIAPNAPARTYSVSVAAEFADGESITKLIQILTGNGMLKVAWDGYHPASTSIRGAVGIVPPRVTSPLPAPDGVTWEFDTSTTDVCSVDARTGALTLLAEGACQVTVTASAPSYADGTSSAHVTVGGPPPPVIRWPGYARNTVEYGEAAPTLLSPSATVNGRTNSPTYRYSVAPASAAVCRVNEATGALTISAAGQCRILLTNVAKPPEYGVGSADALVTVRPGDSGLRWQGYTPSTAQISDPAPRLLPPTTTARSIKFGYSTLTPSICDVDSETGALSLNREGSCIVMVSTSGNPNYRTATETATVVVDSVQPPVIDGISCDPPRPSTGDTVTCTARLSGGEPDEDGWLWIGGDSSGSDETYRTRFDSAGAKTVWLTVRNSAGSDRESTAVTVGPEPPVIDNINCSPPRPSAGDTVTCTARLSGGEPDEWLWIGGSGRNGESPTFRPTFDASGTHVVWLSVSNSAGSDTDSITVDAPPKPPVIDSISCPSSADVNENITCTVRLDPRSGTPTSYSWSGGDSSGRDERYRTSFSSDGTKTVRLTVRNSAGRDDDSTTVRVDPVGPEPPRISSISCPSSADVNENITCTVRLDPRSGTPTSYSWSGGDSSGRDERYRTSFSSDGTKTVRLTVRNSAGRDDDSTTVRVDPVGPEPPDPSISCSARVIQGNPASCEVARNRGGPIENYSWSATGGASSGSSSEYHPRFSSYGRQTVRLTASNDGGSGSNSLPVDVLADPEGWTYARCGSDARKVYWFNSTNLSKHWLDMTWEEVSIRVPGWGEHWIGRLSQAKCDSWPDGRDITYDTW